MEDHSGRSPESAGTPRKRHGEVNTGRENIGQAMKRERGPMREHGVTIRPQPDDHEVLVLSGRKVHEAIDAAANADQTARLNMLAQQLRRIACAGRLLGREVPLLRARGVVEAIPVGRANAADHHKTLPGV